MYAHRVFHDSGAWLTAPGGVTQELAEVRDPGAHASLTLKLHFDGSPGLWDYDVQYIRPHGWDLGLTQSFVYVRRTAVIVDDQGTSVIMGSIPVPTTLGQIATFVEPIGNVQFQVESSTPTAS